MTAALALARRGLGRVWPNPAVGCVLARGGRVVARGWTQPGGRPHAETEAVKRAGEAARGATAYVTLEPCAHHGKTPPCAEALVAAGIARAVVALQDPDPRVDGGGIRLMQRAGIRTELGLCAAEAAEINAGFLLRVREGRPLVTLKLATTLDGRIATRTGHSQWITGTAAREAAHLLRATHDAVLVGANTAARDDPALTCRLPGMEDRSPVRVVVDGRMRLPLTHALVATANQYPTWLVALSAPSREEAERRQAYVDCGVTVIDAPPDEDGNPDLPRVLGALAERGITRLLVEGGGRIAAALVKVGLVDRLVWFRAPRLIGGDGIPAIAGFGIDHLHQAAGFRLISSVPVGGDAMDTYTVTVERGS
jgi:diaminohydroxyphosphoribosylaminopyrimidine deaminase/5-amino-6-(5-phosphoribosylamino)uracil reductase